eukprot:symbB.v1.2.023540.t2/scaffold2159.1/size105835/8
MAHGTHRTCSQAIAEVIPYFPFKKLEKFYDVQGLLNHPKLLNAMCAVMARRFRKMKVTKICGFEAESQGQQTNFAVIRCMIRDMTDYPSGNHGLDETNQLWTANFEKKSEACKLDSSNLTNSKKRRFQQQARGFLFTPVAIKLGVPFIMLRKAGKMPNTISSGPYTKEYEGVDEICVQKGAIVKDDKATVVECACMVELQALNGREKCLKAGAESVWGFISEELLTKKAELPDDYKDDDVLREAVEQKQVAQQQAERARYLVLKAQEEKKRTIIYAEGEKESARMIGDAIKANPGFVELRKISVAKDISNLLAKSANRMVLNTEGLLMNLGIENEGMPKKK